MNVTPEQIAVLAGLGVSALVWLVKVLVPKYDCATTIAKVGPVVLGTVLTVGFAAQWQGGWQLAWQMAIALLSAFGGYKLVGQPILSSLRDDEWKRETEDAIAEGVDPPAAPCGMEVK